MVYVFELHAADAADTHEDCAEQRDDEDDGFRITIGNYWDSNEFVDFK